ncbi:aminotransferase class III-fold pyridoxal phosphate-dependent enzyme, partial [Candidatus Bathyarchaeota archaeon]|nr:aminotransferase class III-fold pyridoxal phosphate-dependent enzyme [Candidatus Bathyarchaeota archaeon]
MKIDPRVLRIVEEDKKYISGSLVRFVPMVVKKGRRDIIEDLSGRKYIDFLCGAAVTNVGHNHPKVVEAAKKAMENLIHTGMLYLYNEPAVKLAKILNGITPGRFHKKVFFGLSGSDAIECSLKMVRWHTRRPRAISFIGSYHGVTLGALSLSGFVPSMVRGFMPLVPGVTHIPYPFCYRCPFKQEYPGCGMYCLEFIEEQVFQTICPPEEVAALYFEPIQGDAGVAVPPREYFPRLLKLCREYEIIPVADEIQTGFGRTGKMFACEHWGIEPEVMVLGKAMGSGFPISAVVAKDEVMDWTAGSHVITCAGSTIACEASIAT